MIGQRNTGTVAALGSLTAVIALLTGLPAARADELADLKASQQRLRDNQDLLQRRIDQLAATGQQQAQIPAPPTGGPASAPGAPVIAGNFPRSFLIPGTDTSLRLGGIAWVDVTYYIKGAVPAAALAQQGGINQTYPDGQGGTGNLPSIPLQNTVAHALGRTIEFSPRASRLLFDARTPTAYGEVKAYIEMDFAQSNTNTIYNNLSEVTNGWIPRLRKAYATMGGLLAGQETGPFRDPDADPELVDQGGETGTPGRGRVPQVRYTFTGPYGSAFWVAASNPAADFSTTFGTINNDTNYTSGQVCPTSSLAATANASTLCGSSSAYFNAAQNLMPDWTATGRITQPWGHVQGAVAAREISLDDGQYISKHWLGYGGTISGDVHPFFNSPGAIAKDDFGGGYVVGNGIGQLIANGGGGVATNFGRLIPGAVGAGGVPVGNPLLAGSSFNTKNSLGRQNYDALVQGQTTNSMGGWIWYQHWWTPEWRSTIDFSGNINYINTNLVGGGTTNNKYLALTHLNLIWSPVGFVDFGAEWAYGHRVVASGLRGDAYTIEGTMRVRF